MSLARLSRSSVSSKIFPSRISSSVLRSLRKVSCSTWLLSRRCSRAHSCPSSSLLRRSVSCSGNVTMRTHIHNTTHLVSALSLEGGQLLRQEPISINVTPTFSRAKGQLETGNRNMWYHLIHLKQCNILGYDLKAFLRFALYLETYHCVQSKSNQIKSWTYALVTCNFWARESLCSSSSLLLSTSSFNLSISWKEVGEKYCSMQLLNALIWSDGYIQDATEVSTTLKCQMIQNCMALQ